MSRKKEATAETIEQTVLYDATAPQRVPFTITKNGKDFPVAHVLKPLSDSRYFEFQEQMSTMADRLKRLSTSMYGPKDALWQELVESREGYREREDWKESTHQSDRLAVVNALLTVHLTDEPVDVESEDELFDDESLVVIPFQAMYNGALLLNLSHSFRQETKHEMDSFLSIETDEPDPNILASAAKRSKSEKLCELGRKMLKDRVGYAEASDVPAWHLAATTEAFFLRQIGRAGKF